MATHFIDLDGTIFRHGTNEFLPGAKELLQTIYEAGDQVVLTTRRGAEFEGHPVYSRQPTLDALANMNIKYDAILFGLGSPRIVINDDGAIAVNHNTNEGWSKEELQLFKDRVWPEMLDSRTIKLNKVKCKACDSVVESTDVKDYLHCSCGAVVIGGGKEYLRRNGRTEFIEELSEFE